MIKYLLTLFDVHGAVRFLSLYHEFSMRTAAQIAHPRPLLITAACLTSKVDGCNSANNSKWHTAAKGLLRAHDSQVWVVSYRTVSTAHADDEHRNVRCASGLGLARVISGDRTPWSSIIKLVQSQGSVLLQTGEVIIRICLWLSLDCHPNKLLIRKPLHHHGYVVIFTMVQQQRRPKHCGHQPVLFTNPAWTFGYRRPAESAFAYVLCLLSTCCRRSP
jgi:hypothetical protein